jgi:folate-dependent tRNA-U54 methylase TrmFO/GidA
MKKLISAIKSAYVLYKNPDITDPKVLEMVGSLTNFIFEVAKNKQPMMSNFGLIYIDGEYQSLVNIWAGPSIDSSPTERIKELLEENRLLKELLADKNK